MPSLQKIKRRLRSIKATSQITKAMKMVAAVKLRKAQEKILAARPYAFKLVELLQDLSLRVERTKHPLLRKNLSENKICLVVITADKGLCGSFNSNIIRKTNAYLNEYRDKNISMILVGRKCVEYYKKYNKAEFNIIKEFAGIFNKLNSNDAVKIGQEITKIYIDENFDVVNVIYNEFKSAISQKLIVEKILPIEKIFDENPAEKKKTFVEYLFEPDEEKILNTLLPMYLNIEIYRILLESSAAEFGARLAAMESATDNALEIIDKLTLQYNRARQANITREISEIVGGANALK